MGKPNDGLLLHGIELPDQGEGYVRARPREATGWATPRLVQALQRAAKAVADRYPGGEPLRIGDLSWRDGGEHPRHGSHRSGRDADVVFYALDDEGQPTRGRGWIAYNRQGFGVENHAPEGMAASGKLYWLDLARNWFFVRSLLSDPSIDVQWIFCSWGVKEQLLQYASRFETDPDILFRANWILHRPTKARPHDDHFHLRLMCSAEERTLGCVDGPPIWPWLRDTFRVGAVAAQPELDDAFLIAELMKSEAP
ncbi:MAG: penicillin-insensitive murein endopeptidase [Myxococcales bacterium]|nr:MAG: penicillin-insensitive murein endopeptidase [Myxococcales bacterium]